MVGVVRIVQFVIHFFHCHWNIVINMVNATTKDVSWLLDNLLEFVVAQHSCESIVHPSIKIEIPTYDSWLFWVDPSFDTVHKPLDHWTTCTVYGDQVKSTKCELQALA